MRAGERSLRDWKITSRTKTQDMGWYRSTTLAGASSATGVCRRQRKVQVLVRRAEGGGVISDQFETSRVSSAKIIHCCWWSLFPLAQIDNKIRVCFDWSTLKASGMDSELGSMYCERNEQQMNLHNMVGLAFLVWRTLIGVLANVTHVIPGANQHPTQILCTHLCKKKLLLGTRCHVKSYRVIFQDRHPVESL